MKTCPLCRTAYDDSQNFCLNDGTLLTDFGAEEPRQVEPLEPKFVVQTDEPATVVHASPLTNVGARETNVGQTVPPISAPLPVIIEKKTNTGKIVAMSVLATMLVVALLGGGIYLATRNRNQPIVQVNDNKNTAKPRNTNANLSNANANVVVVNAVNVNQNANLANANLNANALPSPSPQPSLKPEQAVKIRKDVNEALDGWKDATDNRDLDSHIGFYGDNVDYYNGGLVNVERVRTDRQKAFDNNNIVEVELSNVKITPDSSGEKVSVIFDKSWRFENDEATSEGKVQQLLTMEKQNGRWRITGEKDLKVYYKNKY